MDLEKLEKTLNSSEQKLKTIHTDYNSLVKKLSKDPIAKEYYYDTLDPLEREYKIYNDRYTRLISQYSRAYLEMSEWYVGEYLPYHIFIKEIKGIHTYLDSKADIRELYKLFGFMLLFELSLGKAVSDITI
jgi:hypothetical protein